MGSNVTKVRVVASPQRVDAFIAWLRSLDGEALKLVSVSDTRPRRTGGEVSVYAELVLLEQEGGRE